MMTCVRMALWSAAVALLVSVGAHTAWAQIPRGRSDSPFGPTTSPYLNLIQNNNPLNAVSSYNTLVKPIIDQGAAIDQQRAGLRQLQHTVNTGGVPGGAITGRGGHFMYYSHFYSFRP